MVEAGMKSKKSYEKMLMDGKLKNAKQELYWDMFLFCIFTGLSFSDMRNLKEENIVTYFDDHQWIKINRQKTSDYYRNNFSLNNGFGTLQVYAGFNFCLKKEHRKKKRQ